MPIALRSLGGRWRCPGFDCKCFAQPLLDIDSLSGSAMLDRDAAGARKRLSAIVDRFTEAAFAIVDGGLFDDLPFLLENRNIFARSLFLGQSDLELQSAGPWLVALNQAPGTVETLFDLVGERPAVIYWCCENGETALYRHLRTLNMAKVPRWVADGSAASDDDGTKDHAVVMFRHWDPRVLGALMPLLDAAQFARILGPAEEIAFATKEYGGVRRIPKDRGWPVQPSGMLTIDSAQAAALNKRRLNASHDKIFAALVELAPEVTRSISDADLLDHVKNSDRAGRTLGISSEAAHCGWAYLMLMTSGSVFQCFQARAFVSRGDRPPDEQVKRLLASRERWLDGVKP